MRLLIAAVFLTFPLLMADVACARDRAVIADVDVDIIASTNQGPRPAIVVLSGSKGFGSTSYDAIANWFRGAGMDIYLAHLLTAQDLRRIAEMKTAAQRINYYKQRRQNWLDGLNWLLVELNRREVYHGQIGLLGVSLGAENAALAVAAGSSVDAVILVDGLSSLPPRSLSSKSPPFQLIWGSDDVVYSIDSAQHFVRAVKSAGGEASLSIFSGPHDFFLKPDTKQASESYKTAIGFFGERLKKR
ncbi:dienelactone hydrolase family protein [Rhizobium sp. Leaf262]|uniref:dienelactone hydrolase family protein n=1 Tax=Rhizobium sp. Leaf262 TaxID=1736312 RepID=UPI000715F426|nr:dienelactone hydrolase family protein [Rhizobium sp. Leaf262]KQO80275.1 hypothetical protein ASF29_20170 [Rhizobium sp. Leaf262]